MQRRPSLDQILPRHLVQPTQGESSPCSQVADEVRLTDEGTGGGDEVDAGVQDLLGGLRAADPAHQDQGDGDRLTDLYGRSR